MVTRKKRVNKGQGNIAIALEDTRVVVGNLSDAVRRSRKGVGQRVQEELDLLVETVNRTQEDLVRLKPEQITGLRIGSAHAELDAVIRHTEQAAGDFLLAVEELEIIAESLPKKKAAQIREVTTRMLEASTFQDISGQRLDKAKKEIKEIDSCVASLLAVLGHEVVVEEQVPDQVLSDDDLLNGPQHEGMGSSQEDIDALLASFD
ncbi:MAG: chemotaxis protein CheZ [Alphaproteobacteria bacterium]|jgi:chemotaxis protein CheZ|nr:chemotaxis protein CheZ [Alphaproteobacteria bacterium]MBT4019200.1 chemotaxis protein CheZ [Alphaproteobacteria bacterium]MBT4966070.1 chemotaxis protein CheZ [Alphaproteobacteria bacterium]MBT7745237.1 chemotaxis protein CheZ [Alphaproteobacteria bacterium]